MSQVTAAWCFCGGPIVADDQWRTRGCVISRHTQIYAGIERMHSDDQKTSRSGF